MSLWGTSSPTAVQAWMAELGHGAEDTKALGAVVFEKRSDTVAALLGESALCRPHSCPRTAAPHLAAARPGRLVTSLWGFGRRCITVQRVFISFRRKDTAIHAHGLKDFLQSRLRDVAVFIDTDDIPPASAWPRRGELESVKVVHSVGGGPDQGERTVSGVRLHYRVGADRFRVRNWIPAPILSAPSGLPSSAAGLRLRS
jgi:hypothetical protein